MFKETTIFEEKSIVKETTLFKEKKKILLLYINATQRVCGGGGGTVTIYIKDYL